MKVVKGKYGHSLEVSPEELYLFTRDKFDEKISRGGAASVSCVMAQMIGKKCSRIGYMDAGMYVRFDSVTRGVTIAHDVAGGRDVKKAVLRYLAPHCPKLSEDL